ncbi:MAG: ABC transporter substrate-binding protein [Sphingomonas sp.]
MLGIGALAAASGCSRGPVSEVPAGYPSSYADIERDAETERSLLIWSAIDEKKASRLVADFQRLYPLVRVTYVEMPARDMNQKFIAAAASNKGTADFLWSSAMDLQIKLVNDGYAQTYVSPERDRLPDWANWKDQAWGTTAEPIVMVYNRDMIDDVAMPKSHVDLARFLEDTPSGVLNRIAMSDPAASAVGYLYLSQDQQATHDIWRLARAMGASHVHLFTRAEDAVRDVEAGRAAIGYNIVGSYALGEVEKHPRLGMVLPTDYTLLVSRIAMIPTSALHPNAAKLFLDFLLSRRGQMHLVREDMPSVRADVKVLKELQPSGVRLRAIRVGPGLLVSQDSLTRKYFLDRWRSSLGSDFGNKPSPVR